MACQKFAPHIKTEKGIELFARLVIRPSLEHIEPSLFPFLTGGDVVEISGAAGCGKTELLYHLIAQCILPVEWKGLSLGGLNVAVMFIDNDHCFDIFRLTDILENRIYHIEKQSDTKVGSSESDIEGFVKDCLENFLIARCIDTDQFIVTLISLEKTITTNEKIACIMIDSISSFYFNDRLNIFNLSMLDAHHKRIINILKRLVKFHSLILFITKQDLLQKSDSSSKYEAMGRSWQKFVTHRLELSRDKISIEGLHLKIMYISKDFKKQLKCFISDTGINL